MLLIIFLVLILLLVQVMLPGRYLTEQVGPEVQIGPRDDLPEPTRELARSRRAISLTGQGVSRHASRMRRRVVSPSRR